MQNYEMLLQVCLSSLIVLIGFSTMVSFGEEDQFSIPNWIKETAGFWSQNKVSDSDFLNSMTYLINNELLYIEEFENVKIENELLKTENKILLEETSEILLLQTQSSINDLEITAHTTKPIYGPEDYVVIIGTVSKVVEDQKVSIVISSNQGTFLSIAKVTPNIDGSYAFVTSEPEFKEFGKYLVNAYYAGNAHAQTSYSFTPKQ